MHSRTRRPSRISSPATTKGISAAALPWRGAQAATRCLAQSLLCGREKSVSGSFSRCCQPRATASAGGGGNWRFCVRRAAADTFSAAAAAATNFSSSRRHSGLPAVMRKA